MKFHDEYPNLQMQKIDFALVEPLAFVVDFALENNLKVDSYYAQPEVEISLQMKGMVN